MALTIGDVVDGKYEIVRLLGEGGMGAVYEGQNTRIHRKVAIKVLHGSVASSADAVQRFEREAQAAGRIGSKHIVEVLDLGDLPSGDRYMVMEFMEGQSLADRIRDRGQLTPQDLYPIAVQLLEGLAAAHAAGIVHRDLKPDNVYLLPPPKEGAPDFVKILDFGISKFNPLGGEFSMTRTGSVMGTPYYMSPEQAKGARDLDHRTDLYAAGVILYEGLSGRVPFSAETFNELLFKIVLEEAPPLQEILPDVNPAFVELVAKAMARDVTQRFQTASDFKAALNVWSQRNSIVPLGIPEPAPGYGATRPSSTVMGGTAGAWASTGAHTATAETPAKKKNGMLIGGVAAAVVIVALGVGLKLKSDGDAAAQASQVESDKQAAELRAEVERQAKLAQEQKAAETARLEAEKLAKEAEAVRKQNETVAAAAAANGVASGAAATSAASTKPAAVATGKATAQPTEKKPEPAGKPAATPPTNSGSTTSTGRSIRSTL